MTTETTDGDRTMNRSHERSSALHAILSMAMAGALLLPASAQMEARIAPPPADDAGYTDDAALHHATLQVSTDADMAVILLALDDRVGADGILTDFCIVVPAPDDDGYAWDAVLPADVLALLHWQVITCDCEDGLRIHPPAKVDERAADEPPADDGSADDSDDGRAPDDRGDDGQDQDSYAGIALELSRNDAGEIEGLRASFEAPSDDHDLQLVAIVPSDGCTEVWLYRKSPGPGEGMRDVVEHHEVKAAFPRTLEVRVLLAEGTARSHEDAGKDGQGFVEIARFGR